MIILLRSSRRTSDRSRTTFKRLVNSGRLEILAGGWVMPDEATTHVFSLYNQLVEGHQWIWENLGILPENAWSIDPFGCSSVMAYLLATSGINGLLIQRIHYTWKRFFSDIGVSELLWEQDFEAPPIKLRVQPGPGYTVTDSCGPATGLCSDYDFNGETSEADHVTFGNINRKAEIQNYTVTLRGDFFPYADLNPGNSLAYWTGYYSTRPYWKKLARSLETNLRSTEILYTLTFNAMDKVTHKSQQYKMLSKQFKMLIRARRVAALFQHHDGVTGTSRARVMADYKAKMLRSLRELKTIQKTCVEIMIFKVKNVTSPNADDKLLKKIVVFNNLPYYRSEAIIIKTDYPSLLVIDSKCKRIQSQIKCVLKNNLTITNGEAYNESYELTYIDFLHPFSINTYEIHYLDVPYDRNNYISANNTSNVIDGLSVANDNLKITFGGNGMIKSITKRFGSVSVKPYLKAYVSEEGKSGAYLFKPLREQIEVYSDALSGDFHFIDGAIYKEARVFYGSNYSVSTRLYGCNSQLDEIVELKISYNISETNRELFIEFATDLKKTKFYTDVNSFGVRERVRMAWNFPESNYYPMTSLAYIEDADRTFAIVSDHSHGTASLEDGSIEIMLDRRTGADDRRGLEESVEDNLKASSTLYLLFIESFASSKELLQKLAIQLNNPAPIVVTSNETPSVSLNLINQQLPSHVDILNFRTLSKYGYPSSTALLTLHNLGSRHDSTAAFSKDTKFNYVNVRSMCKTSLTGLKCGDELDELHDIKVKPLNIASLKIFM